MIHYYAPLSTYGGPPTGQIIATFGPVRFEGDDCEPMFQAVYRASDGECPATGLVPYDHLYRRCAPVSETTAALYDPEVVECAEVEQEALSASSGHRGIEEEQEG